MKPKNSFEDVWGSEIKSGGFVQIPNDLIRNVGHLGLTGNQILLLLVIMSYGRGSLLSVRRISIHTGLHENTVRSDIRKLVERKLLYHKWGKGLPSVYNFDALINKIKAYPIIRDTLKENLDMGIDDIYASFSQDLYTNIDTKNKDIEGGAGFDHYKQTRKDKGI